VHLVIEATTDPELLAGVHLKTISVAYTQYFPAGSVAPTASELAETWSERLADPSATALIARTSGRVLGAVAVRADPDFDGEGQLMGLHVLPAEWGHGVGGALHDAAISQLAGRRLQRAGLWVIADNTRARSMYEARRWIPRPEFTLQTIGVTEVRYGRSLLDEAQGHANTTAPWIGASHSQRALR
jgi:ribosomal protein S18 acetylase RimI-like enzyme